MVLDNLFQVKSLQSNDFLNNQEGTFPPNFTQGGGLWTAPPETAYVNKTGVRGDDTRGRIMEYRIRKSSRFYLFQTILETYKLDNSSSSFVLKLIYENV